MGYTAWIFLSEILAVLMLWVVVVEFTNNFNEKEEIERLACERILIQRKVK